MTARAPKPAARPPRLILRFALYTGIVLLAAGVAILWVFARDITARAEGRVEAQTRAVAEATLARSLERSDFRRPVTRARRAELDRVFRDRVFVGGVLRATLYGPRGSVTYSTDHRLIGSARRPPDLGDVLEGRPSQTVTWLGGSETRTKVIRSFVPVRLQGSTDVIGALAISQDYREVDLQVREALKNSAFILIVALLALYASLFPILRRVTAQLAARNVELAQHAETLERNLGEREAAEREREHLLSAEQAARAEAEAAHKALARQNKRLRELDRLKDEFLSLVSHELRTPLTSIRGYLELVLDDPESLGPDRQRFLEAIERNATRLQRLVGDLLFVAQADAGRLTLERTDVDLGALAAECAEAAKPIAGEKRIRLSVRSEPMPAVDADRGRLAQVVDNLVSNAIKFTPEGGRVDIRTHASTDRALVTVSDSGIGIALDEQQRLFERFFRASSATRQAIPGTGLGLAIAKAIVEAHGGAIGVESNEGTGSTFRVELPLHDGTKDETLSQEAA